MPSKTQTKQQHLFTVTFWKVDPDAGTEYAKQTGTIISFSVLQDDVYAENAAQAKRLAKQTCERELSATSYDSVTAKRW